jgi:hypothetical protein
MIQANLITVITDGHQNNEDDQTGFMDTHQREIHCVNNSGTDATIKSPKAMIYFDEDSKNGQSRYLCSFSYL